MNAKTLIMTAITAAMAASVSAQNAGTVPSAIKEATVYFQGAELTHSAAAQLAAGVNELRIEGLSPSIDINSLKIKTSEGVVVTSYEFSVDYLNSSKEQAPALLKMLDLIEKKKDELAKVDIELSINSNMTLYLNSGISKNVSGSENGLGIDDLMKTMEYYRSKAVEIETEKTALSKKKTDAQTELRNLQNQYNQEATKGSKTSGVLKLNLSSSKAVNASFAVTYYTANASWTPYYDINIASTDKPVSIIARSKVRQTTGLDWEKVNLTLSTAVPSNGKVAPLFNAWFLYPQQEAIVSALAGRVPGINIKESRKMAAVQNSYSYDMEEMAVMPEMPRESTVSDYVAVADNELNVTYNIDLPYTIPGNGKEQSIDLMKKEAPAEYKYYSTPKLDTKTYLIAEIPDWQKLGLLSGAANITYDGTYIGESYIDSSSTNEKLTLTLGTDARVAVKREKLQDYSSNRVLGSDMQQTFTYRITVKNNQTRPVKLVTKDQYPISTQKNIVVTLNTKETTKWTANKEDLGVVSWEEELAPGESKVYEISYTVRYPKDIKLNL